MYKYIISLLFIISILVWLAVFSIGQGLKVVACDVGQGDAILIQRQTDQILIDGGPDNTVLDCLGRFMPFWDRQIELVILTHPDRDHAAGLVDVLRNYKVDTILTNDLSSPLFSSQITEVLDKEVGIQGTRVIYPSGMSSLRLGLMHLDVVHPEEGFIDKNRNNYSIVTILKYDQFKALFTGDIEDGASDLVSKSPKMVDVDYIKIPHHGSKNGISEKLLEVSKPETAVISLGARNSYGHPHKEVLDLLEKYDVKVLRTDQIGDVIIK